jgi:hypothetical protein
MVESTAARLELTVKELPKILVPDVGHLLNLRGCDANREM